MKAPKLLAALQPARRHVGRTERPAPAKTHQEDVAVHPARGIREGNVAGDPLVSGGTFLRERKWPPETGAISRLAGSRLP
jgi:hypothetical protein